MNATIALKKVNAATICRAINSTVCLWCHATPGNQTPILCVPFYVISGVQKTDLAKSFKERKDCYLTQFEEAKG